ncbi:hypothetical protein ACFWSF_28240 [Streptomyces sp. NPDC058611]
MSPWIVFSLLVGPGRFEWAAGAALLISLAQARARARGGDHTVPPLSDRLLPLAGMLIPVGIAVLVFDGDLWWLGVALIVVGGWLSRLLKRRGAQAAAPADSGTSG